MKLSPNISGSLARTNFSYKFTLSLFFFHLYLFQWNFSLLLLLLSSSLTRFATAKATAAAATAAMTTKWTHDRVHGFQWYFVFIWFITDDMCAYAYIYYVQVSEWVNEWVLRARCTLFASALNICATAITGIRSEYKNSKRQTQIQNMDTYWLRVCICLLLHNAARHIIECTRIWYPYTYTVQSDTLSIETEHK